MQPSESRFELDAAVEAVRTRYSGTPEIALILGSGLGALADEVDGATRVPTTDLPGYPRSTVEGHQGRLVFGQFAGREAMFVQGRIHLYEGHAPDTLAIPVRLAHALGAGRLLVTNAAGGLRREWPPGTLMFISDHVNHAFASPLSGPPREGEPRFPDMSNAYDAAWLERAEAIALERRIATKRGVYLWTRGPSYETPAEIRYFRTIGADAVGMSTVPEVIQAVALGMKVLGISAITNYAAGLSGEPLDHEEVLEVGRMVRSTFSTLVAAIVRDGET